MAGRGALFTIAKWFQIILLFIWVILLIVTAVELASDKSKKYVVAVAILIALSFVDAGIGLLGEKTSQMRERDNFSISTGAIREHALCLWIFAIINAVAMIIGAVTATVKALIGTIVINVLLILTSAYMAYTISGNRLV